MPKNLHQHHLEIEFGWHSSGLWLQLAPVLKLSPLNLVVLAPSPYLFTFPKGQNLIKLSSDKYKVLYFGLKNQLHIYNTRKRCGLAL